MTDSRIRTIVTRQWELVTALSRRRRGMTVRQLRETLGVSRATVYRDLELLHAVGAPIHTERINGEKRYCLSSGAYPPLVPSPLQVAALTLARTLMVPLEGTRLVAEFDRLLSRFAPAHAVPVDPVALGGQPASSWPDRVQLIDRAIELGKRIEFSYQSVGQDRARTRRVDPVALRWHRLHLYLIAFDPGRDDWRTFKIARLGPIAVLDEAADAHPDYDEDALFAHSANIWTGEPVPIAVRLSPDVARFATEWRLSPEQTLEPGPDGSVVVRAQVPGTVEAMRWVLSWGQNAEALEPPELRAAVIAELAGGLARYEDSRGA